jgi:hypothetical protein
MREYTMSRTARRRAPRISSDLPLDTRTSAVDPQPVPEVASPSSSCPPEETWRQQHDRIVDEIRRAIADGTVGTDPRFYQVPRTRTQAASDPMNRRAASRRAGATIGDPPKYVIHPDEPAGTDTYIGLDGQPHPFDFADLVRRGIRHNRGNGPGWWLGTTATGVPIHIPDPLDFEPGTSPAETPKQLPRRRARELLAANGYKLEQLPAVLLEADAPTGPSAARKQGLPASWRRRRRRRPTEPSDGQEQGLPGNATSEAAHVRPYPTGRDDATDDRREPTVDPLTARNSPGESKPDTPPGSGNVRPDPAWPASTTLTDDSPGTGATHTAEGTPKRPGRRRKTKLTDLEKEVWTLYEKHRKGPSPLYDIRGILEPRFPGLTHTKVRSIVRMIKARQERAPRKPVSRGR